ncbi:MAG: TIGR03032 family protein [Cyanobacteria bacterium P01_C01_bin.72]
MSVISSKNSGLVVTADLNFTQWLSDRRLSLAFTTYQAGKIFFVGLQPNGKLSIFERTFDRAMGLWYDNSSLYLSSLYQIWGFTNALAPGENYNDYDSVLIPQISYVTGDLDIHDLVIDASGKLIFANTLFNCISTVSHTHSFTPLWQPQFISQLVAEDRCHLNGIALKNGQVRFVTTIGQTDQANGWRDRRQDGGCVIDLVEEQIIAQGLSMPHSPRWYSDRLWVLNSGTGEFGYIELETGSFKAIVFCPGYLRGCAFVDNYAVVGISQLRNKTFSGLLLDKKLRQLDTESFCGLLIIDLLQGEIVHWLKLEGVVKELYDVVILPQIRRPMALGFKSDEIKRLITINRL